MRIELQGFAASQENPHAVSGHLSLSAEEAIMRAASGQQVILVVTQEAYFEDMELTLEAMKSADGVLAIVGGILDGVVLALRTHGITYVCVRPDDLTLSADAVAGGEHRFPDGEWIILDPTLMKVALVPGKHANIPVIDQQRDQDAPLASPSQAEINAARRYLQENHGDIGAISRARDMFGGAAVAKARRLLG